ncbi:hypothetical protein QYF61_005216 [Mycteria americana]|uniref:Uncharacterized protein n=1 Tax=Mycteria americana TaxID=33587 RepID=A0AAN7MXX7_MYCAM|nr:hypothetical protein QYF61_005216 [Mycteria americana]
MESLCRSWLLARAVAHGEEPMQERAFWQYMLPHGGPMLEQAIPEGLYLRKGPTMEQFLKSCSLWEGLVLEKFEKDCIPWEEPHAGAGEERKGIEVAEMKLAEGAHCPTIRIINEHVKHYQPQCQPLDYTTIQPVSSPPHCPLMGPVLYQSVHESATQDGAERFAKVKINNIHCSPSYTKLVISTSGLLKTLTSSPSTCGCTLSSPMDLTTSNFFKYALTCSSSTEGSSKSRGCSLGEQGGEDLSEASRTDLEVVARSNQESRL